MVGTAHRIQPGNAADGNARNGVLNGRMPPGGGISARRSLGRHRRVAHPDLVEALRTLLLRRDNRIACLRRLRRARPPQRLNRRRRIRRVVKPRHNLDIQRHIPVAIVSPRLVGRDLRYPPSQRRAAKRALCGVRAVSYGSFSTAAFNSAQDNSP